MRLLVIVLCLLSERFLIHGISYQRFMWFDKYASTILNKIANNKYVESSWIRLAAIVLPILFIVSFVYLLLHNILFGFLGLILSLLIFLYCLGPQNAFYPLSETESEDSSNERVGSYFAAVNSQLFAAAFWYLVGGPVVVLAYRLIALSRQIEPIQKEANQLADILEWIPARITALLFLLVGNFQSGFNLFSQYLFAKPHENTLMLSECGLQAAKTQESEEISMPVAERIVEHATIVFLVIIALLVLSTSV